MRFILTSVFVFLSAAAFSQTDSMKVQDSLQVEKQIKEVTVVGQKKLIERKVDRLVFNVENSISAAGGDALDALKVTPGLRVQNNQITMIGKSGMSVMIDDRILQLSGDDLINYLKSIPSDNIKSIEVITTPPAKYDAEGNSGIVNIVLKKAKQDSWNLTAQESYRQGKYAVNNGGLLFNFNKNKLTLTSEINYSFGKQHYVNKGEYFYPDEYWNDGNNLVDKNEYFSGRLGMDYKINSKLTIGGLYNFSHSKNDSHDMGITKILGNSDFDLIETPATRNGKSNFQTANLHGIYEIDTIGKKLSIDFTYLNYKKDDDSSFETSYLFKNQLIDRLKANNLGEQNINNYSFIADMEHPLKSVKLNYGGKFSFSKTDNNISYFDLNSAIPVLDPNNSDCFIYKERNEALYFSASKNFGEKFKAKAGLRMEATQIEGTSLTTNEVNKRNYTKLFPTVYLNYNISENNSLSINYGRRIQKPGFYLLNPFRWYSNPLSYSTGDPNLQPSFTHNLELSFTHKDISTTLYYSKEQDDFEQIMVLNENDRTQIISPYNCLNSNILGLKSNYTFSKLKWWESVNEFNINYAEFKAILPFITNRDNIGWNFYFSTDNTFYFDNKKYFAFNASWWYVSKGTDQMDLGTSCNGLDIAFKMLFLEKDLAITLRGRDIFGGNWQTWTSYTNGIKQTYLNYGDYNQNFSISVSYKIGNKNIRTQNHDTGTTEEQSRIN
jgi:hypothetical protein